MSWYGTHPRVSKERARRVLPPGACKLTIYLVRCLPEMRDDAAVREPQTCRRCGVTYVPADIVARLEADAHDEPCSACGAPAHEECRPGCVANLLPLGSDFVG